MPRWEYIFLQHQSGQFPPYILLNNEATNYGREDVWRAANDLGDMGWEIVSATLNTDWEWYICFKRQID